MTGLRGWGARLLDGGAYWIDSAVARAAPRAGTPHAVAVYFHGVLPVADRELVDPGERITPEFLHAFIRAMRRAGYAFATPDALADPARPAGNLAILTSDDGYASIERLLPVLEAESAPLTLFLCPDATASGRIYWWDQLYIGRRSEPGTRELLKHGVRSRRERDARLRALGLDPERPAFNDAHRLLTPADVRRLASHPLVHIGNHTRDHLSLPLITETDLDDQVEGARPALEEWAGRPVRHFAFPYGDHDARSVALLERRGYRTAFTTGAGTFALSPRGGDTLAVVPRYRLRGDRSVNAQVRIMSRGVTIGEDSRAGLVRRLRRDRTPERRTDGE